MMTKKFDSAEKRERFLLNAYFTAIANQRTLLNQTREVATELARAYKELRELEDEE
jgi:hypothetical protein